jgi:hypothetical protein
VSRIYYGPKSPIFGGFRGPLRASLPAKYLCVLSSLAKGGVQRETHTARRWGVGLSNGVSHSMENHYSVTPGQTVAIQRNFFGDLVAEYTVTTSGRVATIARDALGEPGTLIMRILYNRPDG